MLSERCGVTILPSSATRRGSGRLGMSRILIEALTLPPCEGGREPKANGGFVFARLVFHKDKRQTPRSFHSLPPSQGGGTRIDSSLLLTLLEQLIQARINPPRIALEDLVAILLAQALELVDVALGVVVVVAGGRIDALHGADHL